MSDPSRMTATMAALEIRHGRLSPRDLLEACLARIAERDSVVRAFSFLDPDLARRNAAQAASGVLHGIPVGVKDVLDTADMPTSYGSPIWKDWQPRADCAAVAAFKSAGGVIAAKTVTTEFATRHPGPTTNPHNHRHTPGGSSSGSAAAVADFQLPVAFGTQTGGSVIRPAAFCGVVGYKPTFGLISRGGMKMMSDSLDTIGILARSVADCALVAGAVSGRDLGDPDRKLEHSPVVGLFRTAHWDKAGPGTQSLISRVAEQLARAGARIEDRALPSSFDALASAQPVITGSEGACALGWERAVAWDQITPVLQERLTFGLSRSEAELASAYSTLRESQAYFSGVTDGLDFLITPSATGEAPAGTEWTGDPVFNYIWTCLHVPCVTIPAGTGPNGLPLGIQIVGRRGEDRQTLAWANWVAAVIE